MIPYMMKLGEAGEAFFVFETEHEVPEEFQTSPIMQAEEETKEDEVSLFIFLCFALLCFPIQLSFEKKERKVLARMKKKKKKKTCN